MYSKTELMVLRLLALGDSEMESIRTTVGLSKTGMYSVLRSMRSKGLLARKGLDMVPTPYNSRLLNILASSANSVDLLSTSGIVILKSLRIPKTPAKLVEETGMSRATVHRRLRVACDMGAVSHSDGTYRLNDKLWPDIRPLLDSLDDQESTMDPSVRLGSTIYRRDGMRILYSNHSDQGDVHTAFTFMKEHGLPAGFTEVYQVSGTQLVSEEEAFDDAFEIIRIDGNRRLKLLFVMYYMMRGKNLQTSREAAEILKNLENGNPVDGWPSWSEVLFKARSLGAIK